VIVDTGSSTTTFPCNDCGDCGRHIDSKFQRDKSDTAEVVQCHEKVGANQCEQCDDAKRCSFSISFAEQSSLKGYFIRDYILFGDGLYDLYKETLTSELSSTTLVETKALIEREHFKTVFGCTTRETNLFLTQKADGIMGLSPSTNKGHNLPNVVDDLFQVHQGKKLAFSLCYNSLKGGYMSIGGYDAVR
jgi:Xylanase inhibitor N-terminal